MRRGVFVAIRKTSIAMVLAIIAWGMSPGLLFAQYYDNPGLGQTIRRAGGVRMKT